MCGVLRELEGHVDEEGVFLELGNAEEVFCEVFERKEPCFVGKEQAIVFLTDAVDAVGVGAVGTDALRYAVAESGRLV